MERRDPYLPSMEVSGRVLLSIDDLVASVGAMLTLSGTVLTEICETGGSDCSSEHRSKTSQ